MKIIFFGSSDFSVSILEELIKSEEIILTVTQPDRKRGRLLKISPTPVKLVSDRLGIKVFQPAQVNASDSIRYLKKFNPDIFIVVSFGQMLSNVLLDLPKLYAINVHTSLLPKYRGASPINWALANGESETGITVIKMNEKMDEGDIILQRPVSIGDEDDAIMLSSRLSKEAVELLSESLELIKSGKVNFLPQPNIGATYAPKLKKKDGLIDWSMSAPEIYNRVRAFVPWPGCFTYWNKKMVKIWKAKLTDDIFISGSRPGAVLEVSKNDILVAAGKGALKIEELQIEGKRRMTTEEFIVGHSEMRPGTIFLLQR